MWKRYNMYGWIWLFDGNLFWCQQPQESHIFCGVSWAEITDEKYMKRIGLKIKAIK